MRNVNQLIQELEQSTLFAPEKKEELLGEAYAIRAWYYFGMAKRYGGVPIIKVPQEYDESNPSALLVNRSTEEATYEFILEDLDNAIAMLPPTRSSREKIPNQSICRSSFEKSCHALCRFYSQIWFV